MKRIIRALTLSLATILQTCMAPMQAAAPTTGQFLFQQKAASGPFTQYGVTPVTDYVFGWDGSNVVMVAPGGAGSVAWGAITGTLSAQTDLQSALNLKLSLAGTLPLAGFGAITGTLPAANLPATAQLTTGTLALGGFGSITGTLPIANVPSITDAKLSANVQLKDGVLGLAGFSSITGSLADARLSANVQLKDATLGLAGFGSITGTLPIANVPSITDAKLSANVQLKDGTLALNSFGSVTGTLAAARIADLSATYLTVAAAASGYQPLDADLTALAALSGSNNLYYRSGAGAWSNVAFGSGLSFSGGTLSVSANGTVTSVGLSAPSWLTVGSSPVTTSGTIAITATAQTANTVLAGPTTGSAAASAFRALVAADIPSLSSVYQPLDAGLTSIGGVSTTNKLYYLSAADTWSAVTVGTGLSFSGGTLTAAAGSATVTNTGTLTADTLLLGNGGVDIKSTTTGTGVVTALGVAVDTIGGPILGKTSTDNAVARFDGVTGKLQNSAVTIDDNGNLYTTSDGDRIYTTGAGSHIFTDGDGSDIYTTGIGSNIITSGAFKLSTPADHFTSITHAATADRAITLPDASGTIALTSNLAAYQPLDSDLTSWAAITRASGFDTFTATPSGANLASLLTTALPATKGGTGLTSLGTGIATALGVNVGSAGAPVLFNGALGTPSSGTISGTFVSGGTFGAVNGSALTALNGTNISSGTVADTRLSSNVQLQNGTLALAGFGSITGTLPAARVADLSATYLTVAAALAGYQPLDADLTSWATVTRAAGFDTFATTPSSANLRALLTDEVGTGAAYFVGGALGTPASGTVTNLTGTASISINGTVGATTPTTGAFTTVAASSTLTVTGASTLTGGAIMGAPARLKNYTVATLPAGTQGDTAFVTDATLPTFLGALVGGGAVVTPVFYNGSAWVSY